MDSRRRQPRGAPRDGHDGHDGRASVRGAVRGKRGGAEGGRGAGGGARDGCGGGGASGARGGGFTLLEALAATLVLSIGIMGVAAMQARSLRIGQDAYARAQAVHIARDFFERLRANPDGYRETAAYNAVDTEDAGGAPPDSGCAKAASGCTARQMAGQDVREWMGRFINVDGLDGDGFRAALPGGRGRVSRAPGGNEFTVVISWAEGIPAAGDGPGLPAAAPAVTLRARLE